jgi:xanthine dehydrogenase molybdenum-binding subunit
MAQIYAAAFSCKEDQVKFEDGAIGSEYAGFMDYGSFATFCEKKYSTALKIDLEYRAEANPSVYSAVFIEVKVDRYSGMVEIEDILVVQDAGRVINLTLAEGQVQGGAQMSLGMALCEEMAYDEKGNLKTDSFSKYHIINAPSMPEVKVLFIEEGEPMGPFGAKSVGELAAVAPAPALMNAINHALGTNLTSYPATPEKIIEALNS